MDVIFPLVLEQNGGEGIIPVPKLRGGGGGIAVLSGNTYAVLRLGGDGAEFGQQIVDIQGGVLFGDSLLHTRKLLVGQAGDLGSPCSGSCDGQARIVGIGSDSRIAGIAYQPTRMGINVTRLISIPCLLIGK